MERHTRSYVQLMKPGITLSNTLSGVAGFLLAASTAPFSWLTFVGAIGGIAGIIASACVVNNVLDRDIDKRMRRTAARGVASGEISITHALLYAALLGVVGFGFLIVWTNWLTVLLGVIAYVWYVVIYGYAKRTTSLSTVIGGVAGALPPMAGYTALTGHVDAAAVALFFILFFWQLPHFYAISMFRKDDYSKAGLPVWAVRYGMRGTKVHIMVTVALYAVSALGLFLFGYTGVTYFVASTGLSLFWVYKGVRLYRRADDIKWAKTMFGISLLVLVSMQLLISIGGYLP